MNQENEKKTPPPTTNRPAGSGVTADKDFKKLNEAKNTGLFSRLSGRFNDALQSGRGSTHAPASKSSLAQRSADDIALIRARSTKTQKMYIPDGVIIEGSLTGGSETEVNGRIDGNVTVDGVLFLGKTALVTGNVRADTCQVEGMVEGKVECSDNLIVAPSGRLSSDAVAGKQLRIAGRIDGNATTPGALRIEAGGVVNGDIKARVFSMDEGAQLTGRCIMRSPSQREGAPSEKNETN
ncbi:MAG TPA: polymer-forming cytoskeletal protein [Candidatus Hydrogenedentes bacterium]|nr:polymer-forming cytoskeletal protein [Candidatus Hydrogenedentota bacterium]